MKTESQRPVGYVASPYTKGDPAINTHFQCRVFNELIEDGVVLPYMPLWSHFQHGVFPRPYEDWIQYDNDIIKSLKLKWILRLNAEVGDWYNESESSGADNEVLLVRDLYPDAIVVFQRTTETYREAIERLYAKIRAFGTNVSEKD